MSLYEEWIKVSYDKTGKSVKAYWNMYMPKEQKIYEDILENKTTVMKGIVSELALRYNMKNEEIVGFIDGINGGLAEEINIEELEANSDVELKIDFEKLYKKMVEYKAEHLFNLPQWDNVFDADKRKMMFTEQKTSGTIVKGHQVGRNEKCPCGSGKKFKQCCGR